jgi:opacity protein-like surface antigen
MRMTPSVLLTALAAVMAASVPSPAAAQYAQQRQSFTPHRFTVGGGIDYAQPVSQFRQYVDHGFGGGGYALLNLDQGGLIGIRADVDMIRYGHATQYLPLGYYTLQEETSNNILVGTIGP